MNTLTTNVEEMEHDAVRKEVAALRSAIIAEGTRVRERLGLPKDDADPAVPNLVDYLALRSHDLQPLQRRLVPLGLSSLGRLESRVLETLVKDGVQSRGKMTDAAMAVRAECVMLNKGSDVAEAVAVLDTLLQWMDRSLDEEDAASAYPRGLVRRSSPKPETAGTEAKRNAPPMETGGAHQGRTDVRPRRGRREPRQPDAGHEPPRRRRPPQPHG
jgi:hypothetical protein